MDNTNRELHRIKPITIRLNNTWPSLMVRGVLILILVSLTCLNPFLGLTSALLLFLMILVVSRPVLIVYGLTLIFPLVGGLARGAVVPFLRIGQSLLLLGFILFLLSKPGSLGKSYLTAIDLAFVLFFLSEAVFPVLALYYRGEHFNLNQTDVYGETPLQILLGPLQYYLLYRIVVAIVSSERQIRVTLELSFIASIIVSAVGILEAIVPSFKAVIQIYYPQYLPSYSPDFGRITSTLEHFSGLGAYLAFTLIVVLSCYTMKERMKISSLLLIVTIVCDSVALILTGTFAAWIGLAIGGIVVFILIRHVPKQFILILFGIALSALIFQPFLSSRLNEQLGAGASQGLVPQSFAFRIQLWENLFLPAIGQHLLFGAGPAPAVLNSWSAEESQYLYFLLRGGLSYFFSYFLLIGVAMAICWQQIKSKRRDGSRPVAIALLAILIALSVMNVSGEYFTYVGGTQTLWTLLAIVVASSQFKELSSPATGQFRDNQWRMGSKASHSPLNKITMSVVDEPADNFLTRKDNSLSDLTRL